MIKFSGTMELDSIIFTINQAHTTKVELFKHCETLMRDLGLFYHGSIDCYDFIAKNLEVELNNDILRLYYSDRTDSDEDIELNVKLEWLSLPVEDRPRVRKELRREWLEKKVKELEADIVKKAEDHKNNVKRLGEQLIESETRYRKRLEELQLELNSIEFEINNLGGKS